ncbi:MAG: LicD family protein [Oscillospiraceae bacterium]|nr:LicD family protein [Oscillospiraceae bacterium]
MTELQETEFEILVEFDRVCRRLELPYFLVCGSALGAVKYGGFIPWDDDIDVALYREDYEEFLRKAPRLLPEHLFLQNWRTDPAYPQIGSKLRNSRTTYLETSAAPLPINHGVFIDIFPMDGYPRAKPAGQIFELRKRLYAAMLQSGCEYPRTGLGRLFRQTCRVLGITKHTDRVAARYERMITRYPVRREGLVCNHANWQGKLDYSPYNHFGPGAPARFEGLAVRVPAQYRAYLTQKYGDYTLDPPEEQRVGHHYCTACDCRRPYTEQ